MTTIRILSGKQIRQAVTMKDVINSMETAFKELSGGRAEMPIRSHIAIAEPQGTALFMPSYMKPMEMIGVKTVTLFEDNRAKGLPYIQGMVSLFDGINGEPKAVLDGMTITAMRTGAVSGLATQYLARKDASVCGIFGAGVQGRTQLEAVCAVRSITKAYIYDTSASAAAIFAEDMSKFLQLEVIPAENSQETVRDADIVCCATISETPVFQDDDLPDGIHLNAVGSYKPHVQEVPEETVLRSRLYVDHRESALEETGDLIIPLNNGTMSESHIIAEIGEVAAGEAAARLSDHEMTFFKSVGVAVQDLAAAAVTLQNAQKLGIGTVAEI